jgi:CHRD domain
MRLLNRIALCAPLVALVAIVVGVPTVAFGDDNGRSFSARFLGVNETPSISTEAAASLKLKINGNGDMATIDYTLTYSGLREDATQAHIHFAQAKVAGGIMVFLCSNVGAPAGTPTPQACPLRSGTVTGTLKSADVIGPAAQGIASGQMARVVKAIRDGAAYGNVHSTMFPAGETRGQLAPSDD